MLRTSTSAWTTLGISLLATGLLAACSGADATSGSGTSNNVPSRGGAAGGATTGDPGAAVGSGGTSSAAAMNGSAGGASGAGGSAGPSLGGFATAGAGGGGGAGGGAGGTSSSGGAGTGTAPSPGTLTAGAWDDNRNFNRFLKYHDVLAQQQWHGLLPFSDADFQAARRARVVARGPHDARRVVRHRHRAAWATSSRSCNPNSWHSRKPFPRTIPTRSRAGRSSCTATRWIRT